MVNWLQLIKVPQVQCRCKIIGIQQSGRVAQLDRASDFYSEGCRFKSCRAYHSHPTARCE